MAELETGANQSEIRYLQPLKIDTGKREKYDRFLRYGLKYVDYKDTDFLTQFVNEQGKDPSPSELPELHLSISEKWLPLLKERATWP